MTLRTREQLQDRIEELEELLGLSGNVELFLDLPLTRQQRRLLGFMMKRNLVTREAAYVALFGDRPEFEQPEIKILNVIIVHRRKNLSQLGIARPIETVWGQGWRLSSEAKQRLAHREAA